MTPSTRSFTTLQSRSTDGPHRQVEMGSLPEPQLRPVPCLGVDEFAVRRGRTYATIFIDMNSHRPVDVLVDRAAHNLAAWLRDHLEVRTVCRDRAGSFRDGACAGAPQAQQVADARHLLHNLAEAVERIVGRHRADLREPLTMTDTLKAYVMRAPARPASARPTETSVDRSRTVRRSNR
ncbi:transposase [Streptomyces sp. NPDC102467]|uniref:transposase n=1 Tax=Streptomyces sp. NPDC102467 TaxID=3366179 RepID=UPI003801642A